MSIYTTEIASDAIPSDNPIHQRLFKAYYLAQPHINGNVLELGCGEGRGLELLSPKADSYTAIDKIQEVVDNLQPQHPGINFIVDNIPPFNGIESNSMDTIISFQVIEHIQDDKKFLEEIYRVLKPGGKAIISTPNIVKTLTRNPWHIREYTAKELQDLCSSIFDTVEAQGVSGNEKIWEYYEMNKKSVKKITRFDIFNLQYRLPASLLRIPYDILNRVNRNKLKTTDNQLVMEITHEDYLLSEEPENSLDLFYTLHKK